MGGYFHSLYKTEDDAWNSDLGRNSNGLYLVDATNLLAEDYRELVNRLCYFNAIYFLTFASPH